MHHIIGHNFDDITHASHSSNIHNLMYEFSGGCLRITSLHYFKLQATYIKHAWWLVSSESVMSPLDQSGWFAHLLTSLLYKTMVGMLLAVMLARPKPGTDNVSKL